MRLVFERRRIQAAIGIFSRMTVKIGGFDSAPLVGCVAAHGGDSPACVSLAPKKVNQKSSKHCSKRVTIHNCTKLQRDILK